MGKDTNPPAINTFKYKKTRERGMAAISGSPAEHFRKITEMVQQQLSSGKGAGEIQEGLKSKGYHELDINVGLVNAGVDFTQKKKRHAMVSSR